MTESQNAPGKPAAAQPAPPTSSPPYDPSADDKLLYGVAAAVVAVPLAVLGFLIITSKGPKAPFRFKSEGLVDKGAFEECLRTGSFRTRASVKFRHPVAKIWETLTGERSWGWIPFIKGVHYVGAPGAGAVRYLKTLPLAVGEQVVEYDEGKTFGYTGIGGSLPVVKQLASRYTLEPTKRGGTKVTWDFAATPKFVGFLPLWLAGPFVKPFLKLGMKRANRYLFPADE